MNTDVKEVREGYKMTELGEIPEEWEVNTIGETFDIFGGMPLPRTQTGEGDVFYLHYGDIHKSNKSIFNTAVDRVWLPMVNSNKKKLKEEAYLQNGDLVFADASEDYVDIGKNVVVKIERNDRFLAGLHTIVAREKGKNLFIGYKKYCFKTEYVKKQLALLATGSTVLGISKPNLAKIKFLNPPLEEQQKIAEVLTTVDAQIEINEKLIEKTEELKKGLMQKLLTKGIGHTQYRITELGEIPAEWEIFRLEELSERILVGLATSVTKHYKESGIPIIRNLNIKKGYFDDSKMLYLDEDFCKKQKSKAVNTDDVITVHTGSNLGLTCLVPEKYNGSQTFTTLITTTKKKVLDPRYLSQHMNSYLGIKEINRLQVGSGKNNLNVGDLKNYQIAVPSIEEQQKIAQILSTVDEQIETYQQEKHKYTELKKGLMQQLLTGKIRVMV